MEADVRTIFTLGWGPAQSWMGQDEAKPLSKEERGTILDKIASGNAKLNAVAAWHDPRAETFRGILGPAALAKYSQTLTDAMARQRIVDALGSRLAADAPGAWVAKPSELTALTAWSDAAEGLFAVVKPHMPAPPPAKAPGAAGPSAKAIVAIGGVVAGVALLVAVVA